MAIDEGDEVLLEIQGLMDGVEWTPDTLDEIAQVMIQAGYRIRNLDDIDTPKPKEFRAEWSIDVDAASPEEAADDALKIQRDPNSSALIFKVTPADASPYDGCTGPVFVDLLEDTP